MKYIKLLVLSLLLCSCSFNAYSKENDKPNFGDNFKIMCDHNSVYYMLDLDTNYIYVYFSIGYGRSICAYCNSKGQPMSYDEFKLVHNEKYHKGEER